jgi:hypothetical protein
MRHKQNPVRTGFFYVRFLTTGYCYPGREVVTIVSLWSEAVSSATPQAAAQASEASANG